MDESGNPKAGIPWPTIIGLLAAVGSVFYLLPPLKSGRPPALPSASTGVTGYASVEARLWQDPFGAVDNALDSPRWRDSNRGTFHSIASLNDQIRHMRRPVVLAVMVSGGPYPEDVEQRVRTRQAVVTAMGRAGYAPEDDEHIAFVSLRASRVWPSTQPQENEAAHPPHGSASAEGSAKTQSASTRPSLEMNLPYEWWRPLGRIYTSDAQNQSPDVLVVWLKENQFDEKPLNRLARLRSEFADVRPCSFFVLGPQRSTTLRQMLIDASTAAPGEEDRKQLCQIQILSATATAADEVLRTPTQATASPTKLLKDAGLAAFRRMIATDDLLATSLVDELRRREILLRPRDCGCGTPVDHVALIGEWDTYYARALMYSFAADVAGMKASELALNDANWPWNLHRFTYLRGIDGKLPGDSAEGSSREQKSESKNESYLVIRRPESEHAFGRDQTDYLRRLAGDIESLDVTFRRDNKEGHGIKAIGVLGSDVYDKLLVLKALRRHFPGVIFFTTELDARLTDPEEFPDTHNLIVASPFGLALSSSFNQWFTTKPSGPIISAYRHNIAPFRDCYQTSLFLSTLIAVHRLDAGVIDVTSTRLYEIGREKAVDISVPRLLDPKTRTYADESIHPEVESSAFAMFNAYYGGGVLFMLFLFAIIFALLHSRARARQTLDRMKTLWLEISVLVLLLLYGWNRWSAESALGREGEPLAFSNAVSIWPTEIVRALTILLAVSLALDARRRLRENDDEIQWEFALEPHQDWPLSSSLRRIACHIRVFFMRILLWRRNRRARTHYKGKLRAPSRRHRPWRCSNVPQRLACPTNRGQGWVDAQKLWSEYTRLGWIRSRWWRVAMSVISYLLVALLVFIMFGMPHIPARGAVAFGVERTLISVSVLFQMILIFYVLELVRQCEWFVRELSDHRTYWPDKLQKMVTRDRQMEPEDLDDLLDIRLIAKRTEVVGRFLYYPSLIICMMIIARNRLFDDWDWPWALVLIISVNAAYCIYMYWLLREAARRARRNSLLRLRDTAVNLAENEKDRRERIEKTIEEIENERKGAFATFLQQPLVGAMLLPGSLLGGWAVLQYLAAIY